MSPTAKKTLRRCALGILLVFVTLIGLVFLVRWRTIDQWNSFKAHWEAQGEHLEIGHFVPEPIPAEENLAMHPVFKDLWIEDSETAQRIAALEVENIEGFNKSQDGISRQRGEQRNFSKWIGLDANLGDEERAAEILRRMEPMHGDLDQIAQALRERTRSQFPVDWDTVFTTESRQTFAFLNLAKAFQLRSRLHLLTGEPDFAVDDLITVRLLAAASGQEDTMIALLVEVAQFHAFLTGAWDGITRQALHDDHLAELDARLPASGYLSERCLQAMRFERAAQLQIIDLMENDPGKLSSGSRPAANGFLNLWWDNNRLAICKDLQEHILCPGGTPVTRPTLADAIRFDDALEQRADQRFAKYTQSIALLTTPIYGTLVQRILRTEAELDNARVAIAVERYRLKHSTYPDDLATLVPEFLSTLPVDEINHRPVEYRLRQDGTPMIYQWGGDGDDDGGTPRKNLLHGDVVWQYPLDPPITRGEYLRED